MTNIKFYAKDKQNRVLNLEHSSNNEVLTARLPLELFKSTSSLVIECDAFRAKAGDEGYYLLPEHRFSHGSTLTYFTHREDCSISIPNASIFFMAVGLSDATYVVLPEMYYTVFFCARCANDEYSTSINITFDKQPAEDDVVLHVLRLPAGSDYNAVAKAIRDYRIARGEAKPLRDRLEGRPTLQYFRKYPLIRIRMGWKPVPPPVLHQTPENEPPMRVACTFARVRDIADELKRQGVEGATLCLVGWNQKGHDGRWPQMFPVEEALGGEDELRKTIKYVQDLGYAIVCHTNSLDHYEIADIFDYNKIARRRNGELVQEGSWSGGNAYRACPIYQLDIAKQQLPKVRELGFSGMHYIDVVTTIPPDTCFSDEHPCSTRQAIDCMRKLMSLTTDLFGGFSSEGCMDFALSELDYSLYNRFTAFPTPAPDNAFIDRYIPMLELTYHGTVFYNPFTETVNYTLKGADHATTFALYGGMPTFYYYSKFCGEGRSNWMGETDLTCDDEQQLRYGVSRIKAALDEYSRFADRQLVFMSSYEELDNGLKIVRYEDESGVIANYTDSELDCNGTKVGPHSYAYI